MEMRLIPLNENEQLIQTFLRMIEEDDYAEVGSILTDDAMWTIVPIGYTWTGRCAIEALAVAAGGMRRHDERSRIEITNWFTDGEHLCVEYKHKAILRRIGLRLTIDGYCLTLHMRNGRFHAIREYISPSNIAAALMIYVLLPLLPYVSKRRLARSTGLA
jgi:ketosteroid isomerase-like protein